MRRGDSLHPPAGERMQRARLGHYWSIESPWWFKFYEHCIGKLWCVMSDVWCLMEWVEKRVFHSISIWIWIIFQVNSIQSRWGQFFFFLAPLFYVLLSLSLPPCNIYSNLLHNQLDFSHVHHQERRKTAKLSIRQDPEPHIQTLLRSWPRGEMNDPAPAHEKWYSIILYIVYLWRCWLCCSTLPLLSM